MALSEGLAAIDRSGRAVKRRGWLERVFRSLYAAMLTNAREKACGMGWDGSICVRVTAVHQARFDVRSGSLPFQTNSRTDSARDINVDHSRWFRLLPRPRTRGAGKTKRHWFVHRGRSAASEQCLARGRSAAARSRHDRAAGGWGHERGCLDQSAASSDTVRLERTRVGGERRAELT